MQGRLGNILNAINTQEKSNEKLLKRIKNYSLMDDEFMTKCFEENVEATELVLQIVLDKPDIKVEKVMTQYSMKNIKGHSVILDIFATDSTGKKHNIEIQRADKGAGAKRARYHSSLIDSNVLPAGFEYEKLAETYVIFITENDIIGKSKPIYHIERCIMETGEYFNDGAHIIYVNASYVDDTNLGKLMHDFLCTNPEDMNYRILATTVKYYKENKEGMRAMSRMIDELRKEDRKEFQLEIADRMIKEGYTEKEVLKIAGITEEEYMQLQDGLLMA